MDLKCKRGWLTSHPQTELLQLRHADCLLSHPEHPGEQVPQLFQVHWGKPSRGKVSGAACPTPPTSCQALNLLIPDGEHKVILVIMNHLKQWSSRGNTARGNSLKPLFFHTTNATSFAKRTPGNHLPGVEEKTNDITRVCAGLVPPPPQEAWCHTLCRSPGSASSRFLSYKAKEKREE